MSVSSRGRTIAVIVARMGSSRLPGKSMLDVGGMPVIERIIRNILQVRGLHEVVVATSDADLDEPIADVATRMGICCHRGDPDRVLDRLYEAVSERSAEVVVEIGGDCPFLGSSELEPAIEMFHAGDFDYLCNYEPPTYPEGFDINIISMAALTRAFRSAIAPSQRIHPFSYLSFHRQDFRVGNIEYPAEDLSRFHWSLDFPEDVNFVRLAYEVLGDEPPSVAALQRAIARHSELARLNQQLMRPPAGHAFWNAPSIIRDMNQDLVALARKAHEAVSCGEYIAAHHAYTELRVIADELIRFAAYRTEIQ